MKRVALSEIVENKDSIRVPVKASDREEMSGQYAYYGASGIVDYVDDFLFEGPNLLIGEDGANLLSRSTDIAFIADGKYWVNNHAHVLGADNIETLQYLKYYINSIDLSPYVTGSAQPKLNQTNLNKIEVPLPSLSDQKAIVAKLDRAQRLIDIDKEMLAKYDELIQSVFLEMFGDPIANSLDWDMVPFTEMVVLKRGYDLRVKDRVEGKYPIMASNGILDWHNEYKVEGPGVVTGRSGTLGKVHYVNDNYWPLNTALYSKELNGNDPTFILYLLKNFNLDRFSRGAGVPTLNRNLVHKEKIIDVPIELQNSFSEKVSQIEKQKSISKLSLKKSEDLFSSLVQGAFG